MILHRLSRFLFFNPGNLAAGGPLIPVFLQPQVLICAVFLYWARPSILSCLTASQPTGAHQAIGLLHVSGVHRPGDPSHQEDGHGFAAGVGGDPCGLLRLHPCASRKRSSKSLYNYSMAMDNDTEVLSCGRRSEGGEKT